MKEIRLVEIFHTLQGEGVNWGRRALFIRMPFCNLACSWCDTKFNHFEKFPEIFITQFAEKEPCRFAVITGGEPMMNKDTPRVIAILKSMKFEIACETNGTFPILSGIDFVTVSPKRDADFEIHSSIDRIDELKFVIDKDFDLEILEPIRANRSYMTGRFTLSPEFNDWDNNVKKIIEYIKENPEWRLSLQTHKMIGVR